MSTEVSLDTFCIFGAGALVLSGDMAVFLWSYAGKLEEAEICPWYTWQVGGKVEMRRGVDVNFEWLIIFKYYKQSGGGPPYELRNGRTQPSQETEHA